MNINSLTSLQVRDITCRRGNKNLFSPVSFDLFPKELLFIEGANGSGKSSLLRILTGLATPYLGNMGWHSTSSLNTPNPDTFHYIAHANGIKNGLTVLENLKLLQYLFTDQSSPTDIHEILSLLQLNPQQHSLVKNLSAGQKRKVALAKLFLIKKPLWILDEPLSALDNITQHIFFAQLKKHLTSNGMCIMSTHQTYPVPAKILRLAP